MARFRISINDRHNEGKSIPHPLVRGYISITNGTAYRNYNGKYKAI